MEIKVISNDTKLFILQYYMHTKFERNQMHRGGEGGGRQQMNTTDYTDPYVTHESRICPCFAITNTVHEF